MASHHGSQFRSRGPKAGKPLTDLGDPLCIPSLLREGPAPWEQAPGPIHAKALLRTQRQHLLRLRPGRLGLAAQLMEVGGQEECQHQAHEMRQPAGQRQRLLHAPQRLVRIAQHPEGQRPQVLQATPESWP